VRSNRVSSPRHLPAVARSASLLLCVIVVVVTSAATGENTGAEAYWPQWRGPSADGVAPYGNPPIEWSENQNIAWKIELPGRGNSTPIVWGDRLFLTTAVPLRKADEPRQVIDPQSTRRHPAVSPSSYVQQSVVLAISRSDGSIVWQTAVHEGVPHDGTHNDGTYASSSPVTDGERVFAHFGSRGLYALDMDGSILWQTDLGDMVVRNGFGEGSSPALHGDTLIVPWDHQGQSFIVALDKATGREIWRSERDEITSWTTPLVVEHDGRMQVITSATEGVRSYDLETGEKIWRSSGVTLNAIPSPVAANGMVFVTSGFRGNVLQAIRLDAASGDIVGTDAIAWTHDRDTPYVPSPLLYKGILYLLKSNSGILSAYDGASGEQHYLERLPGIPSVYASPVASADRIYIVGRRGEAIVLAAGPELRVLATNHLDEGFDASPAIVGSEIYLRGERSLYRISER